MYRTCQKNDISVTYADLGGVTYDFAELRFTRRNLDVEMINLSHNHQLGYYNTIVMIDVLEHLPNPKDVLITLVNHLKPEGKLIITNLDLNRIDDQNHPCHKKQNFNGNDLLELLGMKQTNWEWLWEKPKGDKL